MSLREETIEMLEQRRNKLLYGGINSIPSPFKRFSKDFIGWEQGSYYLFTSFTKGAKTQLVSYLLFDALLNCYRHPETKVTIKAIWFPLEETYQKIILRICSWLLMQLYGIRISPLDLKSSDNDKPLSEEILNILKSKEFTKIVDYFEEHIIFSTEINPTGKLDWYSKFLYLCIKLFLMKNIGKDIKENCIGVYKITCTGNNQFYIGSSKNIKYRWQVHLAVLRRGIHHSVYMQRSFIKYGEDSFKFEIIHTMNYYDEYLLRRLEWYYINKLQPKFNSGAFSIHTFSEKWKEKISESTKKLYTEKGYVNPRKNVGKRYNIYNVLGDQIASNKTCPEVCEFLGIKSYHTVNNLFRTFNGIAYTKDRYFIISVDKNIGDLISLYKNPKFSPNTPICDLDGNCFHRTALYKSETNVWYRDIYKQIIKSENFYTIVDDTIFTLPGLCRIVQQCITEKHLNILET